MIFMYLAQGFEETEAIASLDVMRRGGLEVKTVGVGSLSVTGSHGICVTADMTENESRGICPQGIVLPGGVPGTHNLAESDTVGKALELAFRDGRLIAAICAAPSIPGRAGMLRGKRAVCYPGYENELAGAILSHERTVTDGNIITACGAGAALEFGLAIVSYFNGEVVADKIRKGILA